jgi:hypothetical protein
MKINNVSEAVKFLLMAATLLITCSLIGLGFYVFGNSKRLGSTVTNQIIDLNNELTQSDIMKYDGLEVSGSDVINFIKKYLGDYTKEESGPFSIVIKKGSQIEIHKNKEFIRMITDFSNSYYIKPTSKFMGSVEKNENSVIVSVEFSRK